MPARKIRGDPEPVLRNWSAERPITWAEFEALLNFAHNYARWLRLGQIAIDEVLSALQDKLMKGEVIRSPRAWMRRALHLKGLQQGRNLQRTADFESDYRYALEHQIEVAADEKTLAEREALAELFRQDVESLTPAVREVAAPYYLEHRTQKEICEEKDLSFNLVRKRLERARDQLKNIWYRRLVTHAAMDPSPSKPDDSPASE